MTDYTIYYMVMATAVIGFILDYYIDPAFFLSGTAIHNKYRLYLSVFFVLQIAIIEVIMSYIFTGVLYYKLLIFLVLIFVYITHRRKTLNFIDEQQILLILQERNNDAIHIAMQSKHFYHDKNPELDKLIKDVVAVRQTENKLIKDLINKQRHQL